MDKVERTTKHSRDMLRALFIDLGYTFTIGRIFLQKTVDHASINKAATVSKHFKVAYKLELPKELSSIHNTFHDSNLKKGLSDESLIIPMKELQLDDKLNFVEEPVEVMDHEIKQLKRSRIPIIKVRWNSKRGPEVMLGF
ncbi:hypothetical protein Tco_0951586 [Tanacetum coccineum]|uniref:Tf2-1-like SH3-like domain-containing protein n=1 Tax=Tanacetum coccineum TaxID=301880 RepID=A0ABQ5DXD2_9ASTR